MKIKRSVRRGIFRIVSGGVLVGLMGMGCAGTKTQAPQIVQPPQTSQAEEEVPEAFPYVNPQEYALSEELRFVPAPFSVPHAAPGVGLITGESGTRAASLQDSEKNLLTDSFRAAYLEGLVREIPLRGVLGGDRVHGWPAADPLSWAQNWRSDADYSNSWGIPSLVLAAKGINQYRVSVIHGPILDVYGKSAGIDGANGVLGYGYPCGDEFFYERGRAQRFSLGLITVDEEGQASFIPQAAPSDLSPAPPQLGVFPGGSGAIREEFHAAWSIRIDQTGEPLNPDGPVQRMSFIEEPWIIDTDPDPVEIRELYFQTFEGRREVFILPESPQLSFRVRILRAPFLDAFLRAPKRPLPGAENRSGGKNAMPKVQAGDSFSQALLRGLSFYGLPLSDPMPRDDEGALVEAQRFSAGWMIEGR
jgi:hypothetical protein